MGMICGFVLNLLAFAVDLYIKIIIIEVILHWLIYFGIIELNNKYTRKTMDVIERLTHPVYEKIRKKIPPIANFDFSPLVLFFALYFIYGLIERLSTMFL